MIRRMILKYKPGVLKSTHLFLAAILWSVIGLSLMVRGGLWLISGNFSNILIAAVILGSIKSFFILDKSAKKSIERIHLLADGSCLGAVYSWKTWMLVVFMMSGGFIARKIGINPAVLGFVYFAVGWSLFFSSRHAWLVWFDKK